MEAFSENLEDKKEYVKKSYAIRHWEGIEQDPNYLQKINLYHYFDVGSEADRRNIIRLRFPKLYIILMDFERDFKVKGDDKKTIRKNAILLLPYSLHTINKYIKLLLEAWGLVEWNKDVVDKMDENTRKAADKYGFFMTAEDMNDPSVEFFRKSNQYTHNLFLADEKKLQSSNLIGANKIYIGHTITPDEAVQFVGRAWRFNAQITYKEENGFGFLSLSYVLFHYSATEDYITNCDFLATQLYNNKYILTRKIHLLMSSFAKDCKGFKAVKRKGIEFISPRRCDDADIEIERDRLTEEETFSPYLFAESSLPVEAKYKRRIKGKKNTAQLRREAKGHEFKKKSEAGKLLALENTKDDTKSSAVARPRAPTPGAGRPLALENTKYPRGLTPGAGRPLALESTEYDTKSSAAARPRALTPGAGKPLALENTESVARPKVLPLDPAKWQKSALAARRFLESQGTSLSLLDAPVEAKRSRASPTPSRTLNRLLEEDRSSPVRRQEKRSKTKDVNALRSRPSPTPSRTLDSLLAVR